MPYYFIVDHRKKIRQYEWTTTNQGQWQILERDFAGNLMIYTLSANKLQGNLKLQVRVKEKGYESKYNQHKGHGITERKQRNQ